MHNLSALPLQVILLALAHPFVSLVSVAPACARAPESELLSGPRAGPPPTPEPLLTTQAFMQSGCSCVSRPSHYYPSTRFDFAPSARPGARGLVRRVLERELDRARPCRSQGRADLPLTTQSVLATEPGVLFTNWHRQYGGYYKIHDYFGVSASASYPLTAGSSELTSLPAHARSASG